MDFSVITSEIDIRHWTRLEERERKRERDKEGEIEEDSIEQYIMTDTYIVHASNV